MKNKTANQLWFERNSVEARTATIKNCKRILKISDANLKEEIHHGITGLKFIHPKDNSMIYKIFPNEEKMSFDVLRKNLAHNKNKDEKYHIAFFLEGENRYYDIFVRILSKDGLKKHGNI